MPKRSTAPKEELPEIQFGLRWKPQFNTEFSRRRYCALRGRGNVLIADHRKWLIERIWPEGVIKWHYWMDRKNDGLARKRWVTWWGPGGTGKTTDAAIFGLERWLEAPMSTAVIACSTSVKMLRKRIWGQFAQLHQAIDKKHGYCGELIDSDTMIRWKKGDTKNGIFGLAVDEGPVEEVMQNLIGIHTNRVFLILDEMQGVKEAILRATTNMSKNPDFWFLGMGNPESWEDPLGKESIPVNGKDSIVPLETEEWDTYGGPVAGGGICQVFLGPKSPAILDPEWGKQNPWMINQAQIDAHLKSVHGNANDPSYWSQALGWIPPIGLQNTVLDASIVDTFKCRDKAVWTHGYRNLAALDPAFSLDGDKKVLQFLRLGKVSDESGERWVIEYRDWINVPIDANSKVPLHYQIANFCKAECEKRGIKSHEFATDSSGEGGGLVSIFQVVWGNVVAVDFGGKPSELPVKSFVDSNGKTVIQYAYEVYDRRVSELNLSIREFAQSNGIRGIGDAAIADLCARRTEYKNGKWKVETKKEMKKRINRSPDNGDACAIGAELCRQLGAIPSILIVPQNNQNWQSIVHAASQEFDSDNYTQAPSWEVA